MTNEELFERVEGIEWLLRLVLSQTPPRVAAAEELDGANGDPVVKFPSKNWTGENFDGVPFSQTSVAFLTVHAEWLQFKAINPQRGKDLKYARYAAEDAAKARGWALRLAKNPPKARTAAPRETSGGGYGFGGSRQPAPRAPVEEPPALGTTGGFGADDEIPF